MGRDRGGDFDQQEEKILDRFEADFGISPGDMAEGYAKALIRLQNEGTPLLTSIRHHMKKEHKDAFALLGLLIYNREAKELGDA